MRRLWEGLRTSDSRLVVALVYLGVILTALEMFYLPTRIQRRLTPYRSAISLEAGVTWAVATAIGHMIIPMLLVLFVHRERPSSIGYSGRGFFRHIWIYLGMYLFMLPFILMAAERKDFARIYPFVAEARKDWAVFWQWEAAYLMQFFALESFFRGYILFSLEKKIGWNAIFVMAVPYCMIHYHKPYMEAFGALIAGIALGAMALRYRSFYGGAILHALVGFTMDYLAVTKYGQME